MSDLKLTPDYITGFVDGEGCFHCSIVFVRCMKLQRRPIPEFVVAQHKRSIHILYALQDWFQCGLVKHNNGERFCFCVRNIVHLSEIIVPFFELTPLKIKHNEFIVFKEIVQMMKSKQHLTISGLTTIDKLSQSLRVLKRIT